MKFKTENPKISLITFVIIGSIIGANTKPPARIYGGKDSKTGQFKWMVSLSTGYEMSLCGGAIISSRYILTAAHCLEEKKPSDLFVYSGITDLRDRNGQVNTIARLVMHHNYRPPIPGVRQTENDIGIIVLNRDLKLEGLVSTIPLPTKQPGNQKASISGWGDTNENPTIEPMILQTADVQVIEDDDCRDFGVKPKSPQFFCGYQKTGNILNGDSGSPLVSDGVLIGIASSGYGIKGVPDLYANVYNYIDWINFIMRQNP